MSAATGRRTASALERHVHGHDVEVLAPSGPADLAEILRAAEGSGELIAPAGDGAHATTPDPPPQGTRVVSACGFRGALHYEPDDFTVGVAAGTSLSELHELLAAHGQEIPLDLPAGGGGTVGGLVARGATGFRQGRYGPLSAFVLGVEGMRGGGLPFRSGGMVVKNVAGYQIHKLVVGALGRAGFLLRVNFRLRPLPARRCLGLRHFEDRAAAWEWAASLRAGGLEPAALAVVDGEPFQPLESLPLPARRGRAGVLWVFEGNAEAVEWLRGEALRRAADGGPQAHDLDADAAQHALQGLAAFAEPGESSRTREGIVRLAVLPSALSRAAVAARQAFPEGLPHCLAADVSTGLLTVRWTAPEGRVEEPLPALRKVVQAHEGAGRLLHLPCPARRRHRHDLCGNPNAALADAVLSSFDPARVLAGSRGAQ